MSLSLSFCSSEAAQGAQTQHSSEGLGGQGQLTGSVQPVTNWFPDTLPAGKLHCKLSGGQGRSQDLPELSARTAQPLH